MVTTDDVRAIALSLPRAYEVLVRDRVKFRVGRLVFVSLSRDETLMGFGYPKEERAALVASDPDTFLMPITSDERYNWIRARLAALASDNCVNLSRTRGRCACRRVSRARISTGRTTRTTGERMPVAGPFLAGRPPTSDAS